MQKIILILLMFNSFMLIHCNEIESNNSEREIIDSIKISDAYYLGTINIHGEESTYEIQISHSEGFNKDSYVLLESDSGKFKIFFELVSNETSWEHIFLLSDGKYKIYYPSYIEVFYSKSEGETSFIQEIEIYNITLYAYDENDCIIATASGSANTENEARKIALNSLNRSAPDAVLISPDEIINQKETMNLVEYTMKNGNIEDIIVDCRDISQFEREDFSNAIRDNVRKITEDDLSYSMHWNDGVLMKFVLHAQNMNITTIKEIELMIEKTHHKDYSQ